MSMSELQPPCVYIVPNRFEATVYSSLRGKKTGGESVMFHRQKYFP